MDLAGSERQSKTGTTVGNGEGMLEGKGIMETSGWSLLSVVEVMEVFVLS